MPVLTVLLTALYVNTSDSKIVAADLTEHSYLACALDTNLVHGLSSRNNIE